jgi:hypothetical protein
MSANTNEKIADHSARSAFLLALAANAAKDQSRLIRRHWLTTLRFDLEDWIFAAVSNLFGWLSKAALFGDRSASTELARLRGTEPAPAFGIVPPPRTQERLEQSYRTIAVPAETSRLDETATPELETVQMKTDRLVRSEVHHEGTRAFLEAAKLGGAESWIRRSDGRGCAFCKLRSGETFTDFAAAVPIHPNCQCDVELQISEVTS